MATSHIAIMKFHYLPYVAEQKLAIHFSNIIHITPIRQYKIQYFLKLILVNKARTNLSTLKTNNTFEIQLIMSINS